ncbi:unnamed protein product [Polarella glacialis]|uniref:Uncharacterized protein n=1 Tax=Polarella glacialis TaxID=89957 RepID=A0A813HAP1_POLGL|nr:unnamed protein product [Polarella glacialis]
MTGTSTCIICSLCYLPTASSVHHMLLSYAVVVLFVPFSPPEDGSWSTQKNDEDAVFEKIRSTVAVRCVRDALRDKLLDCGRQQQTSGSFCDIRHAMDRSTRFLDAVMTAKSRSQWEASVTCDGVFWETLDHY